MSQYFSVTTRGQNPHNSVSVRSGEQFEHYIERRRDGAIIDIKRFNCGCIDAHGGWVLAEYDNLEWGQRDLGLPANHVCDKHIGSFLVHNGGYILAKFDISGQFSLETRESINGLFTFDSMPTGEALETLILEIWKLLLQCRVTVGSDLEKEIEEWIVILNKFTNLKSK